MTIITVIVVKEQEHRFSLIFDAEVRRHLRSIEAKYHALIRATIEEQLSFEPEIETRNRKPLQRPAALEATWELRFGPDNRFRVLYEADVDSREVHILAVGVKEGNRLKIAGREVKL